MLRPRQLVVAVAGGVILAILSGVSARAVEAPRPPRSPGPESFPAEYTLSGTVKEIDTVGQADHRA